jgi:hypothetical protein
MQFSIIAYLAALKAVQNREWQSEMAARRAFPHLPPRVKIMAHPQKHTVSSSSGVAGGQGPGPLERLLSVVRRDLARLRGRLPFETWWALDNAAGASRRSSTDTPIVLLGLAVHEDQRCALPRAC